MFLLRINGPETEVGKLRMKPNLGGLVLRQLGKPATWWVQRGEKSLDSYQPGQLHSTMKTPGHLPY